MEDRKTLGDIRFEDELEQAEEQSKIGNIGWKNMAKNVLQIAIAIVKTPSKTQNAKDGILKYLNKELQNIKDGKYK